MNRFRVTIVVISLLALTALAIGHAFRRFQSITEASVERTIADLQAVVSRLATRLESEIEQAKQHTAYLAALDSIQNVVENNDVAHQELAAKATATILRYFPSFGGVYVVDSAGRERLRVERMGGGIGVIPTSLLHSRPEEVSIASTLKSGEINISALEYDVSRVDVTEEARYVLRYRTPIEGTRGGVLVLSLYAAPLILPLRKLQPIPGVFVDIFYGNGRPIVDAREKELFNLATSEHSQYLMTSIWNSRTTVVHADEDYYISSATGPRVNDISLWRLIAKAPVSALENTVDSVQSEFIGIAVIFVLSLAAVCGVGIVLVKLESESRALRIQREAEQKLIASERLATIGRLTAGIAHEINNPLAGIGNYLALVERETSDAARRKEYTDLVRHGIDRISAIVRDLLSFSTAPKPSFKNVDLETIFNNVERVTRHDSGFRDIEWRKQLDPNCKEAFADPYALEQVFLNLALNSRDAFLRNATKNENIKKVIFIHIKKSPADPKMVEITFEDSGPGIPPDVVPRIFEPFFTTRNNGTGLGLSVCATIIRSHGGEMKAGNREQGGARFTITLRAASDAIPTLTANK